MKTNYFSRIEIMRAENGVIVTQAPGLLPPSAVPSPVPPSAVPSPVPAGSHSNDYVFTDIEELFEFLEKKIVMPDMPQPAPAVIPESYKHGD